MLNILVLDPYKRAQHRIAKDNAGAYGTANHYGNNLFCKILNFLVRYSYSSPPLYAAQIIGELKSSGHNVEYDQKIPKKNYDLYIIISSIVCHETEIEVVKKLKLDKKNIIAVGVFATTVPQKYIEAGAKVVSGEPDMFFHNFNYKKEELEKLPNLIKNFKTIDLNELSLPGWEIIFKFTKPKMKFLGPGNSIYIQSSRGCPYPCFFYCTYPTQQGRVVRRRTVDNLIGEISYWSKNYNINSFLFRDPVFSINNKTTLEVCKKIKDSGLKIKFGIETHLNNLSEDLAKELYDCGLRYVEVGIESVTDEVITASKRFSIEKEKQVTLIKNIEKIGIKIKTMFIYGLPLDNLETCKASLNFAKKINSSYSQYNIFTPYPGTPIYKEYEKKITSNKYEDFSQSNLVFTHDKLSRNDLSYMISKSYRDYYLRKEYFFKIFKNLLKTVSVNI